MRVALTGTSGFIGSVLARRLAEAGHAVTGLVRATSHRDHIEPYTDRLVTGDQADDGVWPDLLDGADAVVHNALDWEPIRAGDLRRHLETNVAASVRLLHASAPRPFVFMSTIAVHHDMLPRWNGVIDEDHPTRPGSLYGAAKAAVEVHLWAAHVEGDRPCCALRPCAVYGIDPRLERSIGHPIIERLQRERRYDRPGGGKFVHVDDVAAAALGALADPASSSGVFNLVDCYARWGDLAVMADEMLGTKAQIDLSSPASPRNRFDVTAARRLGAGLDRGHAGLREHLRELIARMGA